MLSLVAVALMAPSPVSGSLQVGFGEVDVTPDIKKPVYLAGFGANRKATSVHDPIMARAVVLSDGKDRIALVSVDVVGLFFPFVENVRAKLPGSSTSSCRPRTTTKGRTRWACGGRTRSRPASTRTT